MSSRRRWIYVDGVGYEVGADHVAEPRTRSTDAALWGDRSYDGLHATDGTAIDSRSKHREYMRLHGLTTMDDFTVSFAEAQRRKAEYVTSGKGGAVNRADVERAIYTLQRKK